MEKNKSGKANQVRIIGGIFRSRKLTFPTLPGLRPTGDRTRETLFNWLAPYIVGARCLDLFAGSGALGIEALSRGASQATFLDASPQACEAIRNNLNSLDRDLLSSGKARIICTNTFLWLDKQRAESSIPFSIAFLDPPFDANLNQSCCNSLEQSGMLEPESLIYIEEPRDNTPISLPINWRSGKARCAGSVHYQLLERKQIV